MWYVNQSSAQALGFNAFVGNLAYDFVNVTVSVHGKLKLVPKLNEFGNPRFKQFFYGRFPHGELYPVRADV